MATLVKLIGVSVEKLIDNVPVTVGDNVFVRHGQLVFSFNYFEENVGIVNASNHFFELTPECEFEGNCLELTGYVANVVMTVEREFYCVTDQGKGQHEPALVGDVTSTGWLIEEITPTTVVVSKDGKKHTLVDGSTHASIMFTYGLCFHTEYKKSRG